MPIVFDMPVRLEGICTIEEASELADWLREHPGAPVDLAPCEHLHTALLQTLLALRPPIAALPTHGVLRRSLEGVLTAASAAAPPTGPTAGPSAGPPAHQTTSANS